MMTHTMSSLKEERLQWLPLLPCSSDSMWRSQCMKRTSHRKGSTSGLSRCCTFPLGTSPRTPNYPPTERPRPPRSLCTLGRKWSWCRTRRTVGRKADRRGWRSPWRSHRDTHRDKSRSRPGESTRRSNLQCIPGRRSRWYGRARTWGRRAGKCGRRSFGITHQDSPEDKRSCRWRGKIRGRPSRRMIGSRLRFGCR